MNKSVNADSTSVWYTISTMPLVVLCWSIISSIPSDIQRELPVSYMDNKGVYMYEKLSPLQKNISRAAYFPFIVPPARCSPGTRTGCGACFIQKGPSPEPAIPATNYDSHELCRPSSETKNTFSRLPQVRSTPVHFYALQLMHQKMPLFRNSSFLPGWPTTFQPAVHGLIPVGFPQTRHNNIIPARLLDPTHLAFSANFQGYSPFHPRNSITYPPQ